MHRTESRHPGIDVDEVDAWMATHIEGLTSPLRHLEQIPGGHSNLTYLVTDAADQRYVLRRPPLGELLPGAHDMTREYRAIEALGPTAVPVPDALGLCEDHDVTGADFYVMSFVEGHVLHDEQDVLATYGLGERHHSGLSLAEVLAALHAVDIDEVGLSGLGKREDYVGRQLTRWYRQYKDTQAVDVPLVDELYESLLLARPPQQRASVVHGDYRLGNCLIDDRGEVIAVLDWEICTLGDPLADLGYMLVSWADPSDEHRGIAGSPSTAPGFASRDELLECYASASDLDLDGIGFYMAFNHWKWACISEGVFARYRKGQKSSEGVDLGAISRAVEHHARLAVTALEARAG